MTREMTIVIADDHPLFRRGLREVIEEDSRFCVVGEAPDGETAIKLIAELRPQTAIIDIDMPRLNGLDVLRAIRKHDLSVAAIFLTMYKEEDMFNAALDLGVKAYVLKENAADDILVALEKISSGQTFVSVSMSEIERRRANRVQRLLLSKPQIDDLTPAERRILKLIAEDRTSKEIADLLKISAKTVENHRLNICKKLRLHGSHSLLKFAFDHKSYF
jgi:DNA-binding NarL/FixJ family response regulator